MSHSSIFPIQDESFKRDALDFFSFVSQDQIAKYMDDFKQRKLLFSTAHFSRISGTGIWQARKSRLTFLGLIQIIRIRKADREASVGELVSLGCEKAKVSAF